MKEYQLNQIIFFVGASFGSAAYAFTKDITIAATVGVVSGICSYIGKECAKYFHNKFKTKQNV